MFLTCAQCEEIKPCEKFCFHDKQKQRRDRTCMACRNRNKTQRERIEKAKDGNWLFLGCTHLPYQDLDLLDWIEALQAKYGFKRLIHLGDLYDWGNVSRHGTNPNMKSPADEYAATIPFRERLFSLFPQADLVMGNHDVRVLVKAAEAGIPEIVIKGLREAMGLPEEWVEHGTSVVLEHPYWGEILCVHGDKVPKSAVGNAKAGGKHFVMADRHTQANVTYGEALMGRALWGMSTGCGIDESQLAFKYAKKFIPRPIISVGAIIDNVPQVILMDKDKHHRWTGKL